MRRVFFWFFRCSPRHRTLCCTALLKSASFFPKGCKNPMTSLKLLLDEGIWINLGPYTSPICTNTSQLIVRWWISPLQLMLWNGLFTVLFTKNTKRPHPTLKVLTLLLHKKHSTTYKQYSTKHLIPPFPSLSFPYSSTPLPHTLAPSHYSRPSFSNTPTHILHPPLLRRLQIHHLQN